MRRILSFLRDIRALQLKEGRADTAERLQQLAEFYRFVDAQLSGLSLDHATGFFNEPATRLQEAMMSADFTYAIQEFVQRQMVPGYQEVQFAFEPLVRPDTAPNYLAVTRYQRRAGLDDLEYLGQEKGEPRPGSFVDATKRQYQVYQFGKQFDFSMQALVNDDLGYFNETAQLMGRAARRTLEKYVSRMYTNATSIARLTGLGVLYSQNGRLTTARISECRMAFNQRTDARGERITAALRYLVHHSGLVDTVQQIIRSQQVAELATNAVNVITGTFTPIEDPHMAGTAPNLPWWGFTDHRSAGIAPLVLVRRQGMPGPLILRKKSDIESVTSLLGAGADVPPILGDFATGNVVIKVVDEWGTYIDGTEGNLFDFRGAYYSSGTAP